MNYIKYHWFGLIVSTIVLFFLSVFTIVLIAPRYDEQKRGFVACSSQMAEEIQTCRNKNLCVLGKVIDNTFCNIGVIKDGFVLWWHDKQNTPWANYLYKEEIKTPENDIIPEESLKKYYQSVPDINAEMENLKILNKKLEVENEE